MSVAQISRRVALRHWVMTGVLACVLSGCPANPPPVAPPANPGTSVTPTPVGIPASERMRRVS